MFMDKRMAKAAVQGTGGAARIDKAADKGDGTKMNVKMLNLAVDLAGTVLCLMTILQLPYVFLISVFVGVTNMIPYFGPFIGAIPGIIIMLVVNPIKALIFTIMILCLQQFDGLFLGPKLMGDSTGIKPFWIIFAVTLGGKLFGVAGMFLGVPVMAILVYFAERITRHQLRKKDMVPEDIP